MGKNIELETAITKKRKNIEKAKKELQALLETCTHDGYLIEDRKYYPSSYYDKAETVIHSKCELCGKIVKEHIITHGWG